MQLEVPMRQFLVSILGAISSLLLVHLYVDTLVYHEEFTVEHGVAIGLSLLTSVIQFWPQGEGLDHPVMLIGWPFIHGWRNWGKTLVSASLQSMTLLIALALVEHRIVGTPFAVVMGALATVIAFCGAALAFSAPKGQKAPAREAGASSPRPEMR